MTMNDEQLESLLRQADPSRDMSVSPSGDLAHRVRTRQTMIRRGRLRVRGMGIATTCYLAGVLTMWFWMQRPVLSEDEGALSQGADVPSAASQVMSDHDSQEAGSLRNETETPRVAPVVSAGTPYEALRTLGDRYLLRQGKVELAVEVYARALDHASQEETAISYEHDSWLLISLKRDRLVSSL